jgi:hypothetical protein
MYYRLVDITAQNTSQCEGEEQIIVMTCRDSGLETSQKLIVSENVTQVNLVKGEIDATL